MRIGVFGAGSAGQRHVTTLRQLIPESDITVYDPAVLGSVPSAEDLWRAKPEAVFVCAPPSTHFQLVTNALHNGAHVFCEKPLASEPWQAETLVGLARKMARTLVVGYNLRWQMQEFYRAASGHDCLYHLATNMSTWPSRYRKDVLEECSHELDSAVFVNGPVQTVGAAQVGTTWSIRLRHFEAISAVAIEVGAEAQRRDARSASGATWTFDPELNAQAYRDEVVAFLNGCATGEWDERLCPAKEARHVVDVIEACRKAAAEFRLVRL